MIKKGVEPESIIILIKSLSSSLIPPISKYHCSMLVPDFEIQIVQLPLKFIFNNPSTNKNPTKPILPIRIAMANFHGKHTHRKF